MNTAGILYTKIVAIASKFGYFYFFCWLCWFLCKHNYVNLNNCFFYNIYHFQLFSICCVVLFFNHTIYCFASYPSNFGRVVNYIYPPLIFVQLNEIASFFYISLYVPIVENAVWLLLSRIITQKRNTTHYVRRYYIPADLLLKRKQDTLLP